MKNVDLFDQMLCAATMPFTDDGPDTLLIGDTWMYHFGLAWYEKPDGLQLVRSNIPEMFVMLRVGGDVPPIHVSGIGNYLECARAWYYRDGNWGMDYKPDMNGKITFGNWWHYAAALMAHGYSLEEAYKLTVARQFDLVEDPDMEELTKLKHLLQAHEKWQKATDDQFSDKYLVYHYAEQTFKVDVDGVLVEGQWDALVKQTYRGHEAWYVLERKTTTNPENLKNGLGHDFQPRVYVLAAEQYLDEPVAGVIYEIVRNTDPYNVKMLKNGLPSKAVTELDSTSYEVYKQILDECIERYELDPATQYEKYADALDYLKRGEGPSIFQRMVVYVSDAVRHRTVQQLAQLQTEMLLSRYGGEPMPNLRRHHCQYCPYKGVCTAHDEGWDFELGLEYMEGFHKEAPRFDDALAELIDSEA